MTFSQLRSQYPTFTYTSFETDITPEGLKITHHFQVGSAVPPSESAASSSPTHSATLPSKIEFHPTVTIAAVTAKMWAAIPAALREAWVFQLGLAEIPSYWKATASPEIVIQAGYLSPDQLAWWQDLLIKGMGEYFYRNNIDFTQPNFITWRVESTSAPLPDNVQYPPASTQFLIPVGGGKDSALTLGLLNQSQTDFDVFLLNPTPAMTQVSQLAHPQRTLFAHRIIDPTLLELNQKGYLNGHVPFSAYLGFLSRFTALIFGVESVVISNERSSNEGNVVSHGHTINHQYSKTFEFEKNFTQYLRQHRLVDPSHYNQKLPAYFSLLRPLYELQIAQLFAHSPHFDQYAPIFRSCNRGQKTNTWCGQCSKCLFSFIMLYPFLTTSQMTAIFGYNLLDNLELYKLALALLGQTETKPFDCVGTHEESLVAFYLAVKKHRQKDTPQEKTPLPKLLPRLLERIETEVLSKKPDLEERSQAILQAWNTAHQLPAKMETLLKDAITNLHQIS